MCSTKCIRYLHARHTANQVEVWFREGLHRSVFCGEHAQREVRQVPRCGTRNMGVGSDSEVGQHKKAHMFNAVALLPSMLPALSCVLPSPAPHWLHRWTIPIAMATTMNLITTIMHYCCMYTPPPTHTHAFIWQARILHTGFSPYTHARESVHVHAHARTHMGRPTFSTRG